VSYPFLAASKKPKTSWTLHQATKMHIFCENG
jgi:hypothetical protein